MQDAEEMTLGMWVDYIIEYNNMMSASDDDRPKREKVHTRQATQADFDRF